MKGKEPFFSFSWLNIAVLAHRGNTTAYQLNIWYFHLPISDMGNTILALKLSKWLTHSGKHIPEKLVCNYATSNFYEMESVQFLVICTISYLKVFDNINAHNHKQTVSIITALRKEMYLQYADMHPKMKSWMQ